ncbi:hypothetical protein SDC9_208076 [bioreactor metagenome]|uniref:Uncharacterized protein n=1 Tax=bioreactor metagenome TaxID=1076179 RepID=A0A645J9L3_9ZZZZ
MGHKRSPVLRMLCAVFRPDRNTKYNRHLQHVPAHGLPFGQLIEHFIATTSQKIAVHDLGYNPPATHGVTNGRSHDRGFGYG